MIAAYEVVVEKAANSIYCEETLHASQLYLSRQGNYRGRGWGIAAGRVATMGSLPLPGPAPYFQGRLTYVFFQNFGHFSALRLIFRGALNSDDYGMQSYYHKR